MSKAEFVGFVNIRLEEASKALVKKRASSKTVDADIVSAIERVVDSGYSVSIAPDVENGSLIATLVGRDKTCANPGYATSQRHSNAKIALLALFHSHFDLADGGDWQSAVDNGDWWDW